MSEPADDVGRAASAAGGTLGASADRVDSHLHLWQLAPEQYSWLTPEHGLLHNTFTAGQAQKALFGAGVGQAILVQADDTAADTEAMLLAAAAHDWIVGVVGWLPLEDPAAAAAVLDSWADQPALCGVRTLVHDDPRADVLALPAVRESLALVAKAGLPFDVPDAFPRHLGQVAQLAGELPELTLVLDHLGKPPRGGTSEQMAAWERQLRAVAARPNTVAKLSGLHCAGVEYSAPALGRVWDIALDAFGPQRLMFGGDWPVSLLGGSYRRTFDVAAELIGTLSPAEAHAIWAVTSRRTYKR